MKNEKFNFLSDKISVLTIALVFSIAIAGGAFLYNKTDSIYANLTDQDLTDTDNDGLTDYEEVYVYGTNPTDPDTDNDGLNDYEEVYTHGTNPTDFDTDSDGLNDYEEVYTYGTNPTDLDTDSDGLNDGEEILGMDVVFSNGDVVTYYSDPTLLDTDAGGIDDGDEIINKTNPQNFDDDYYIIVCSKKKCDRVVICLNERARVVKISNLQKFLDKGAVLGLCPDESEVS